MANETIAVGVLLESFDVPTWQHQLLEQLQKSDFISVRPLLVPLSGDATNREQEPCTLLQVFERFQKPLQRIDLDACKSKNINNLFNEFTFIDFSEQQSSGQTELARDSREEVSNYNFDVILALTALDSIDLFCTVAKYGVWFFWHDYGQTTCVDGSLVGLWEVLKRRPYIYSALVIRRDDTLENAIAYQSYSGIQPTSFDQSKNEHLWKVMSFVRRTLQRMHHEGAEQYMAELTGNTPEETLNSAAQKWRLTNSRLFFPVTSYMLWRLWRKAVSKLFSERWMLWFTLTGDSEDLSSFDLIRPPIGRFWADPFVLCRDGYSYIFFEDASVSSEHGHISVMRMQSDGTNTPPVKVIEKAYHLSYPFVFEWKNKTYMIPESAENHSIELYGCSEFPHKWELMYSLMDDVLAFDTTLVEHDEVWWLFTNIQQHPGASSWDELYLFYSDSPISTQWRPHPMNPIVSDVRRARPAGKIFTENGNLYRPSQDSSHRYGYGLNINRIVELTKTTYREKLDRKILPDWRYSANAVHTINQADQLIVVDAICRFRRKH